MKRFLAEYRLWIVLSLVIAAGAIVAIVVGGGDSGDGDTEYHYQGF